MTNLSTTQIAQLTALLTGGGFKRSATKEAAVARFVKVAGELGVPDAATILDQTFENATLSVNTAKSVDWKGTKNTPAVETVASLTDKIAAARKAEDWNEVERLHDLRRVAEVEADEAALAAAVVVDHSASNKLIADAIARDPELAEMAKAPEGGPGLARLRRRLDLSALATTTVADGEKARAAVAAKMPKAESPKPKARDRAAPANASDVPAPTASRSKLDPAAKIVAVVENPKKAGSRSHARFALYKVGATVQEFIDACVAAGFPAKEATADISWDRRKNFITIASEA